MYWEETMNTRIVDRLFRISFVLIFLLGMLGMPNHRAMALSPCPVSMAAYWQADGNAADSIGSNNGTLRNASYAVGIAGQSFVTGPDQYVEVPDSPDLDIPQYVTIEAWVNPAGAGGDRVILSKGDSNVGDGWHMMLRQGNTLAVHARYGTDWQLIETADTVPAGSWHHVAYTYDGAQARLYIDGVEKASRAFSGLIQQNGRPLKIGTVDQNAAFFSGQVDEIALSNSALSAGELAAHVQSGLAGEPYCTAAASSYNPWLEIWVPEDRIQVVDWPLDTTVLVTIDNDFDMQNGILFQRSYVRGNEPRIDIQLAGEFDIQPGQVITVTDASYTRFHQVTEMQVTGWDMDLDTIRGTAQPHSPVNVHARNPGSDWAWRSATADDTGSWSVDFSEPGTGPIEQTPLDIQQGTGGAATQGGLLPGDGGQTHIAFNVSSIFIVVQPEEERVYGFGWPLGTELGVEIDDPLSGPGVDRTGSFKVVDTEDWKNYLDLKGLFDIQPGQVVTVHGWNITRQHTVTHLAVTGVDAGADTVSGTGTPGDEIHVGTLCDETGCASRNIYVDENGDWLADFSVPQSGHGSAGIVFDLRPGESSGAFEFDQDYDATNLGWSIPNPTFNVRANNDQVEAYGWDLGDTLSLRIHRPATPEDQDYTASQTVTGTADWDPSQTYVLFKLYDLYDIQPGDLVSIGNGHITKTTAVTDLAFTGFDLDADTVTGTAVTGARVNVWTCDGSHCVNRHAFAGEQGDWSVDFAHPGTEENEQENFDLQRGTWVDSSVVDDDGDSTMFGQNVPNPYVEASLNSNWVHARGWPSGTFMTMTINGGAPYTAVMGPAPWNPGDPNDLVAEFNLQGYAVKAGDVITASGGDTIKTLVVSQLDVTGFDLEQDLVSGKAASGTRIQVCANQPNGCVTRWANADGAGNWTVDYQAPGTGQDDPQTFDIQQNSSGWAAEYDADSDRTWYDWRVPNPGLSAVPDDPNGSPNNLILGWDWEPGTTLHLCIEKLPYDSVCEYSDALIVPAGWIGFAGYQLEFDVDPAIFLIRAGQRITLTNGLHTAEHIVTNMRLAWVDFAAETIGGTAEAGSQITIWAQQQDSAGSAKRVVSADQSGQWTASFATPGGRDDEQETLDLRLGQTFFIPEQADEQGNSTKFWWQPYNPTFGVRPADDSVEGWQWPLGATVTITIDDPGTPGLNPDFTDQAEVFIPDWSPGERRFDLNFHGRYDLKPGDLVTVSDGTTTKTHTALDFAFDEINPGTDRVFGHASPLSRVDVWACWENTCANREETSGQQGRWQADFSVAGNLDWEQATLDIRPGSWVDSSQKDEDGDGTYYGRVAGSTLAGTVYLGAAAPENALGGVMVEACNAGNFCRTALTDGSGKYRIEGLAEGSYHIRAIPPGSNLPGSLGPVELSYDEILAGQDVPVAEPPLPPPPDAVEPAHTGGGTLSVYWMDDLTLTVHGCTGGTAAFTVIVLEDGYTVSGAMTETSPGSATYQAAMPALYPHHGVAVIRFSIECPGGEVETPPEFPIYIDPSGVVIDTAGAPVVGATVTLFHADSLDGPFSEVPAGSVLLSPSNRENPDTTDASGRFGWDVVSGFYKVKVEKPGCFLPGDPTQAYVESAVLTIPPPVTGLELVLQCEQPPSAEAGGPYTTAWGADLRLDGSGSSDPDNTIVSYAWDLDGDGQYDDAAGATPATAFHQTGTFLVGLQVTDESGLTDTDTALVTVLGWTLKGFYQPVDMNGVYNIAKGGSTVSLKFEILAGPVELTAVTDVKSITSAETGCNGSAPTDGIEYTGSGGTSLRYDTQTGQYIYNWKTPKTPGRCYRVTLVSLDGTALLAYFKIK
jgi:protocatechuate 3,4-dioxygenase beta subunit